MESDEIEELREQRRRELQDDGGDDGPTGGTPDDPIHVDGQDDLATVTEAHDVVLADFYADWCGPCKAIEPVVARIAEETEAAVAKVDVDRNQPLAAEYGVRGVPTLLLFVDGAPAERMVGLQNEASLMDAVRNATEN
jgi:thioredoxin 1